MGQCLRASHGTAVANGKEIRMSIVHGGKRGGERLARRVAHAAGTFEHLLVGRVPSSVTVVADGDWMVLSIHEAFSPGERRVASNGTGGFAKVDAYHRHLFSHGLEALCGHVRTCTGVWFRGGAVHVDRATGSVLKTLTTRPAVDMFLLGEGVPTLGIPIDTHLHANGVSGAGGRAVLRHRTEPEGPATKKKVANVGVNSEES
jgi:uncharacterized protein YbcI